MPKRSLDSEDKENQPEKKTKVIDDIQEVESPPDDDDEEVEGLLPIGSVIEENEGHIHPTNKLYFIYENTEPNMISNTARFWSRKYLKVLRHVNPDAYDVYF